MKQRVDTINQNLQNLQSTTSDSVVGKMPAISTGAGRGLGGIEGSSDFDVSFDKSSMALGSLLYDSQDGGKGGKGGGSDYDDVSILLFEGNCKNSLFFILLGIEWSNERSQ